MNNATADATDSASSGESNLSEQQEIWLSLLNVISGSLSVFGSSMIIYLVRKNPRPTPYRRIMLGLSVCDVLASMTFAVQPFTMPRSSGRVYAIGNDTTCSIQGFFTQASFSTLWYNGFLSIYYLMTVKYGMKNSEFARKYERWMHISAISYNWIAAIIGVSINLFSLGELGLGCWIGEYPDNCVENNNCYGQIIGWFYAGVPTLVMFTIITVSNIMIYFYIKNTVNKSSTSGMSPEKRRRINQLANQGFFYVGTFFMCYIWAFIVKAVESLGYTSENEADLFVLLVLVHLFLPGQGILNLFVYTRPNYLRARDEYPDESILWAIRKSWFGSISPNHSTDAEIASAHKSRPAMRGYNQNAGSGGTPHNSLPSAPVRGILKKGGSRDNHPNNNNHNHNQNGNIASGNNNTNASHTNDAQQERRLKASEGFTQAIANAENALRTATASQNQAIQQGMKSNAGHPSTTTKKPRSILKTSSRNTKHTLSGDDVETDLFRDESSGRLQPQQEQQQK